jgi:hypothetical protein
MESNDWAIVSRLISAYLMTCRVCQVEPSWEGFMETINEKKVG